MTFSFLICPSTNFLLICNECGFLFKILCKKKFDNKHNLSILNLQDNLNLTVRLKNSKILYTAFEILQIYLVFAFDDHYTIWNLKCIKWCIVSSSCECVKSSIAYLSYHNPVINQINFTKHLKKIFYGIYFTCRTIWADLKRTFIVITYFVFFYTTFFVCVLPWIP